MTPSSKKGEEIFFEEDRGFFLKKKAKHLGLGVVLLILPPVGLYYMFWYLLEWSSLFEKETGGALLFLVVAPLYGVYLLVRALLIQRMRIYEDRIPSPVLLSKRYIPLEDISRVVMKYSSEDVVWTVELHLKEESEATLDKHIILGEFLESDAMEMIGVFTKRGVKAGLG